MISSEHVVGCDWWGYLDGLILVDSGCRGTLRTPGPADASCTGTEDKGLTLYFSLSFGFEGGTPASLGKLQWFPAKFQGGKTLSVSGAELAALSGNTGTGVGIVIDNAGAPGAYSSRNGMRLGFSLRNIATARANVAKATSLTHDEVMASAWREWNSAMSRLQVLDDPSTPAMQRELGTNVATSDRSSASTDSSVL